MTAIRRLALAALVVEVLGQRIATADEPVPRQPLFRVADLNVGESQDVELSNGKRATIKLLGVEETRDKLRSALRLARVTVEVNGVVARIESGNYRLPMTVGDVQIDCPATQGLYRRHDPFEDSWGLDKQARLRLWPRGSPWMEPGTFGYPIKQRWFGNATQAGNEPSFVMGEDAPTSRTIYYHAGNDIGGVEGRDQVVSASDGLVISARGKTLAEYPNLPFYQQSSPATVYVVDAHGWIYRYTHLKSVDPAVRLGGRIKIGQPVGRVGKEEGAGYYAHLHFDIKSRKPSGKWGVEDAYAFCGRPIGGAQAGRRRRGEAPPRDMGRRIRDPRRFAFVESPRARSVGTSGDSATARRRADRRSNASTTARDVTVRSSRWPTGKGASITILPSSTSSSGNAATRSPPGFTRPIIPA